MFKSVVTLLALVAVCAFADWVYTPNPFPCQYIITEKKTVTNEDYKKRETSVIEWTNQWFVHGTYYKESFYSKEKGSAYSQENYMIRSDITNGESVKETDANWKDGKDDDCDSKFAIDVESIPSIINDTLAFFIKPSTYQMRTRGTFQEKDCYVYTNEDKYNDKTTNVYVDDDNVLIGQQVEYYTKYYSQITVSKYQFEFEAPLQCFTIDRGVSSKCDADVYVAPTEVLCFPPSSSSSGSNSSSSDTNSSSSGSQTSSGPSVVSSGNSEPSVAMTTKAAFAVTLFSMAATLVCLF